MFRPFILSRVTVPMRFRGGSDKGTSNFVESRKRATETLAMIRQAFGKKAGAVHACSSSTLCSGQTEKRRDR
jgi:hypothetical protein